MFGNIIQGIGNFATNAFNTGANIVSGAVDFLGQLPEEAGEIYRALGNTIYGGAQQVQEQIEEGSGEFAERARTFYVREAGSEAAQKASNTPLILIGVALAALFLGSRL